MFLYSIKDALSGDFGPVFESKNHETAKRSCKVDFAKFPSVSDFDLYVIGEFNRTTGVLELPPKETGSLLVCHLSDLFPRVPDLKLVKEE